MLLLKLQFATECTIQKYLREVALRLHCVNLMQQAYVCVCVLALRQLYSRAKFSVYISRIRYVSDICTYFIIYLSRVSLHTHTYTHVTQTGLCHRSRRLVPPQPKKKMPKCNDAFFLNRQKNKKENFIFFLKFLFFRCFFFLFLFFFGVLDDVLWPPCKRYGGGPHKKGKKNT